MTLALSTVLCRRTCAVVCLAALCASAHAGDVSVQAGLPGGIAGYARPLGSSFGLRVDLASVGKVQEQRLRDGIRDDPKLTLKLKQNSAALLADWSPMRNSLRVTGGVTTHPYRLDMAARGADGLRVALKFPTASPSMGLGLGRGHQVSTGLRLPADEGAMAGLDAELASLRDTVARVRAVPQVRLGLGNGF